MFLLQCVWLKALVWFCVLKREPPVPIEYPENCSLYTVLFPVCSKTLLCMYMLFPLTPDTALNLLFSQINFSLAFWLASGLIILTYTGRTWFIVTTLLWCSGLLQFNLKSVNCVCNYLFWKPFRWPSILGTDETPAMGRSTKMLTTSTLRNWRHCLKASYTMMWWQPHEAFCSYKMN